MSEKEGVSKEQIVVEVKSKEKLQDKFMVLLSQGEVHAARNIIKEAKENDIELDVSTDEYKNAAQKAVEDSLRKGHVRHALRLINFTSDNKISVDLSTSEIAQSLSEGFEVCGPQKKEKILEFAKQNKINIET